MALVTNRQGQGVVAAVATSVLLSACAGNPLVGWQSLPEPAGQLDSMATARADAATLKVALNEKASAFVGTKVALNDALLGLGVLSIGLGAGKAHRDAIVGTAGLAGAAYLFGTQDLQDPTLQVYQSGIGAVNCAVAAVRPLQVTPDQITEVKKKAENLQAVLSKLAQALAAAETTVAFATLPAKATATVQQQLADARATYAKAVAASADAATLEPTVVRAAGGLKGLIAEIHASVNKLVSKSVVDSASIPASLNSLVKVVAGFAPGLGVDAYLSQRLAAGSLAPKSEGGQQGGSGSTGTPGPSPKVLEALAALAEARQGVANVADPLAAQLAFYKNQEDAAALTRCGVIDAASALTVDRPQLEFAVGADSDQSKSIAVSGGTKPYQARFRDSPTRGIEVINPLPGDRSIEVRVPKGAPAGMELGLLVTDASSPPHAKVVPVRTVAAAPQAGDSPTGDPVGEEFTKAQVAKDAMIMTTGDAKTNLYTIEKVAVDQGNYKLTLSCKQGNAKQKDSADAVVARLVDWLGGERKLTPKPPTGLKARITLEGGAPCLKG